MFRLLHLFNLRHLRRKPLETFLCLLGIALGVAVMAGIDLANQNALQSFRRTVEAVTGKATHQIFGGPAGIPDSLAAKILSLSEVQATPILEYVAGFRLPGQPDSAAPKEALHILAVDPFTDTSFRDYSEATWEANENSANPDSTAAAATAGRSFLLHPGAALVDEAFARTHHLKIGDALEVLVGNERKALRLVGLIPEQVLSQLGLENLALLDVATGQEILGRVGYVDRVDIIASESTAKVLAAKLPSSLRLELPARRSRRVDDMLRSFRLNLTALSFLAVFVGMFLIYNTMMFSVIHRRKQIGILRCLGVTPRQIIFNTWLEAFGLGVIGSLLGLWLGTILAEYATRTVTATISDLYVFLKPSQVATDLSALMKTFLIGLLTTLLASAVPIIEAAKVRAAVAVRRSALEFRAQKFAPRFAVAGFAFLVVAIALSLRSTQQSQTAGGFFLGLGAALAVASSAIFLTPLLTLGLVRMANTFMNKLAGIIGVLSIRNIQTALSRTAVAIAALMISLSMVLSMSLMITSFRHSVNDWVKSVLLADVYLQTRGFEKAKWEALFSPEFIQFLERQPEVEAIDLYGVTESAYRQQPIFLIAISAEVMITRTDFIFANGDDRENWRRLIAGEVFLSDGFARRFHKAAGDTVILRTMHGPQSFRVAAVFVDYSFEQGQVMMDHRTYNENWGRSRITNIGVFLKPQVDFRRYVAELRRAVAGRYAVNILSNRELRDEVFKVFDQSFAITHVMQILAGIVAFIGIISAVMSLLVERTRELGILRAVGMRFGQLRRLVFLESGLMGGFAALIAVPAGTALALVMIYVINLRTFNWTINFQIDLGAYAQIGWMALAAALLAAIYPMWRLKKISIVAAIREE
ncbi:ABC transporter permease [candidate division KSB1 bacterium]|nr:ABC transporter permease [candidate division KSB1 bacterium]